MNFSLFLQNEIALERQIVSILNSNFHPYYSGHNHYNFRCNICGDSKTHKNKRRGYLLKNDGKPWHYYCHNGECSASMSAVKWMREYFPLYYKDYIREVLNNKNQGLIKPVVVKKIKECSEKEDIKFFIPILKGNGKLFEDAIQLCKTRLIDDGIWSKWYVAIDGKYRNRLIIPFFDNMGKIYYWQGLKLKDWMIPKYMSRLGDQFNNIYNYYNVDRSREVVILEGVIDSLFVENSIALTGVKIHDDKINTFKKRYWLFDHDKAGRKKSLQLLEKQEYVFNWNKFMRDLNLPNNREKWDINEVLLYLKRVCMFSFVEIEPYFTNSIYHKVNFII